MKYNFSKNQKIFLGDTGSLIIGILCATMTLQFIKFNGQAIGTEYYLYNAPLIAISILGIALFDTLRLFMVRLYRRTSPLHPDRNHVHHLLVDLNISHKKVTLMLGTGNVLLILLTVSSFTYLNPNAAFFLTILFFVCYSVICHQLQFSNARVIKFLFIMYIRLFNGKRIIRPLVRS